MVLRGFLVCLFFCFVCLFLTQWFSFSDVFLHGLLVWDKRMIALPWISWAVSLGLSFFLRIRQGGPFGDSRRSSFAGVGGGGGYVFFQQGPRSPLFSFIILLPLSFSLPAETRLNRTARKMHAICIQSPARPSDWGAEAETCKGASIDRWDRGTRGSCCRI